MHLGIVFTNIWVGHVVQTEGGAVMEYTVTHSRYSRCVLLQVLVCVFYSWLIISCSMDNSSTYTDPNHSYATPPLDCSYHALIPLVRIGTHRANESYPYPTLTRTIQYRTVLPLRPWRVATSPQGQTFDETESEAEHGIEIAEDGTCNSSNTASTAAPTQLEPKEEFVAVGLPIRTANVDTNVLKLKVRRYGRFSCEMYWLNISHFHTSAALVPVL